METGKHATAWRSVLVLLPLVLRILAAAVVAAGAQPAAPNTRTGWFGNTYRGGDRRNGRWVQLDMDDIFVFPNGRVVADCGWDEAGRAMGFYRDGQVIGKVADYTALTGGI